MSEQPRCELCGEPMPPGEQMFKFHGYSGPCPKGPLERNANALAGISDPSAVPELISAVQALFDADHYDHFASRMSDSEMAAIDRMKAVLPRLTKGGE